MVAAALEHASLCHSVLLQFMVFLSQCPYQVKIAALSLPSAGALLFAGMAALP